MRASIAVVVACAAAATTVAACRSEPPMKKRASAAAPVEPRVAAIGDTSALSAPLQRAFDPAEDFTPMPEPGEDDWLAVHPEDPQTFDEFVAADTNVPDATRRVIYLQPIGEFPATAPSIDALARIVHAFFTLDVRVLPAVSIEDVDAKTRVNKSTRQRQLLAPDVLDWLAERVPADAFGVVGVTMTDLYPEPSWNFVFGMASLHDRVGVQSFARQDPAFFGDDREPGWEHLALRRATWTLVHEISHMFGLPHCTYWKCVIAGSNHQDEADSRPLHPCPVCLRKLHHAIGFDPAAREHELARVLRELGIDDEAAWSEHRERWIRDGTR